MLDTSLKPQTEPQYLTGDAAKSELTALAIESLEWMNPSGFSHPKIDDLLDERTLHKYDPHLVADVAKELGLTIIQCCMCHHYKANGIWLKDSTRVAGYGELSHTFCEPCEKDFRDKWDLHPETPAEPKPDACYHH
jgi:hypothetical protein